jgi:hypothetical protein
MVEPEFEPIVVVVRRHLEEGWMAPETKWR